MWPLDFTAHHDDIELSGNALGGLPSPGWLPSGLTVATKPGNGWSNAVCGGEMRRGLHYATFTLRSNRGHMLGVIGADFDPTTGGAAYRSQQGWIFDAANGLLWNAERSTDDWPGKPQKGLKEGDVVVRPLLPLPNGG